VDKKSRRGEKDVQEVCLNLIGRCSIDFFNNNVVIKRSIKGKVWLKCHLGGLHKPKPNNSFGLARRKCVSRKVGCLFEIQGRYFKEFDSWKISKINDEHNHEIAFNPNGHSIARRLTPEEVSRL
jgi:hypothetical protein